jgi:hypothetical protein
VKCLSISLIRGGNNLGVEACKLRTLFCHYVLGKKLNSWETVEDFDAKMYQWAQNLLCHELFMLLKWKFLLSREHSKRALYI